MTRVLPSLLASLLLAAASPAAAQEDVVLQAMKDELARSMDRLRLESLDKPYFIAYRAQERSGTTAAATFGALVSRADSRSRYLAVEVRVGDPKLDNTNFLGLMSGPSGVVSGRGFVTLPLEDDYKELRRQVWLATDAAYKRALEDLSRKRAAVQNRQNSDPTPDFAAATPVTWTDPAPAGRPPVAAALETLARDLSAPFKDMPAVQISRVSVDSVEVLTRYVNSEGTAFTRRTPLASVVVTASTQAADGLALDDFLAAYGRTLDGLPKTAELLAAVKELGTRLTQLRSAPVLDRYNGPVLFEGQAAAEVFHQAFAALLPAVRRPVLENEAMGRMFEDNPLLERLGAKVLPESMSLVDDPTLAEQGGRTLPNAYAIDDDGVRPTRTVVVEKGILKTLLTTRAPVRGVETSNGHRRGGLPAPGTLVLVDEKGLTAEALKAELIERARKRGKDYGIVVRRVAHPLYASREGGGGMSFGPFGPREGAKVGAAIVAYKVFPDGREELVRNLEPSGLVAATFKEIVASGQNASAYTVAFDTRNATSVPPFLRPGFLPGDTAHVVVSLVVPSLLFDDVTLQKPTREASKPPLIKHPSFDK
jgi:predicted Zn-dependent protease